MRDAVIVEAVRTPVGRRGGVLSGVHPVDLSAHVLRGAGRADRDRPRGRRRRHLGLRLAGGGADLQRRPQRGPGSGLAAVRPRHDHRPAVRLVAAVARLRRGRAGERAVRPGRRRRGGVDVAGRARFLGLGLGAAVRRAGAGPLRRRARGRGHAGVQPGDRRGDDRRAVGAAPRAARRVRAGVARARGRRHRRGPVHRPDRAGVPARRHRRDGRRGDPPRRDAGGAGGAEDSVPRRAAGSPPPRRRRSPTAPPRC